MRRYIAKLKAERVATLKAERVATLKAYLQAAGLSDTILSESELAALDALRQNRVEQEPVLLKKIFRIEKGKRLTKAQMLPGSLNYIGAISNNNGIRQKINSGKIWEANCITVNYNGSVGYSFYQDEPFHASDDVNVLYLKDTELNRNIALYFCTILFKVSRKFSYSEKWTKEKMENTEVNLPIVSRGVIDWEFIKTMISAQIKLSINNLIFSKDLEISATEEVISDSSYFNNDESDMIVELSQAAEPFEVYKLHEIEQTEKNGSSKQETILIGCYRDRKHLEWILDNHIYNIRLGRRKGSMENHEYIEKAKKLYLYDVNNTSKVYVFRISGNKEMTGAELRSLNYPRKSPGKCYMTFKIDEIDCDKDDNLPLFNLKDVLDKLPNHANGAPVFIEPNN